MHVVMIAFKGCAGLDVSEHFHSVVLNLTTLAPYCERRVVEVGMDACCFDAEGGSAIEFVSALANSGVEQRCVEMARTNGHLNEILITPASTARAAVQVTLCAVHHQIASAHLVAPACTSQRHGHNT